jgi:AdoMet-dependent heme synthase
MSYLTETLVKTVEAQRIPFDVTIELTRKCNQFCGMCYHPAQEHAEMDTETVKNVLSRLARAGTLFCTFTGGEPLLRPDCMDLVDFATCNHFAVTLKTNGTLLTDAIIRQCAAYGVMEVHASLLGGSAPMHDGVTGLAGSFEKLASNVQALRNNRVPVVIMSVITRENLAEMIPIATIAASWGIEHVNFSALLFPRTVNDRSMDAFRLTDSGLELFYATLDRLYGNVENECTPIVPGNEALSCTAIRNGITIAPDGTVYACSALPVPLGNIITDELDTILFSDIADTIINGLQISSTEGCCTCADRFGCIRCPGIAYLDHGGFGLMPKEACRHTAAFKTITGRKHDNRNIDKTEDRSRFTDRLFVG